MFLYLCSLIDADSVVQSQTVRQLHLTAPLQTSELEECGHWQQLQKTGTTRLILVFEQEILKYLASEI